MQMTTTIVILRDVEVTPYGTIIEEVEIVCTMTGFRRRVLVEHTVKGLRRSVEVRPRRIGSWVSEKTPSRQLGE